MSFASAFDESGNSGRELSARTTKRWSILESFGSRAMTTCMRAGLYPLQTPRPACGERVAEGRVRGAFAQIAASGAPHPALRATFSPRAGRRAFARYRLIR